MRPFVFGSLVAAALILSAIGQTAGDAAEPNQPDQSERPRPAAEDNQASQILREMAEYLEEMNRFSVNVKMDMRMEARGMKQEMGYDYLLKLDRPSRFAMILNEGPFGVSVYCDGETVKMFLPMRNRYTAAPAPETLAEFGESDASGSMHMGMMMGGGEGLGSFLSGKGFAEEVMKDIQKTEYLGQEEINGVTCHHVKLAEEEADVEVWIEAGDRPLPHRIVPDLSRMYAELGEGFGDMNIKVEIRFVDWKLDPEFDDEDFQFTPPEGAEKADSLFDFGDFDEEDGGPHPLVGEPAPKFETMKLGGEPLKLEDHLGTDVVLLDFWAEWCGPCREGLPIVSQVAGEFADKGVVFYAVNLGDDEESIREFLEASDLELPVALDQEGEIGALYEANAIPQTVLIGKDGRVQVVHVGLLPNLEEELRQNLNDLVEGKDLATATLEQAALAEEQDEAEQPEPEPRGLELTWSVAGKWNGVAADDRAERVYAVGRSGELIAVTAQGEEAERVKLAEHGSILRRGDLLGDDEDELLSFDAWGHTLHAHTSEGKLLWKYALGQGIDDVWAADLTGDGLDEVIVGYNGSTGLHVLDNRGTVRWKDTSIGNVWHVTAGDYNGDGGMEVVTTSAAGRVHVFSGDGEKLKDLEVPLYANMVRMIILNNGDRATTLAVVGGSGERGEQLLALAFDGEKKWLTDLPDVGVDHIDSTATASSHGLIAVAMRGGLVHVVDAKSGQIIAHVGRQGQTPRVAWLAREGQRPLLVVATGRELNAFDVTASDSSE